MRHLDPETLARLVDEAAEPVEAEHLTSCAACAAALDELHRQTEALNSLPELLPPVGGWDELEARMRSEGLVRDPGLLDRLALVNTPAWMRAAAAMVLFLGGTALGAFLDGDAAFLAPFGGEAGVAEAGDPQDAAARVQVAEERYIAALTRYRELLAQDGETGGGGDPASRVAALEYLVAASQAAVRQAPTDPFLNGLLASTLAEREAVLTSFASSRDDWF